MSTQPNALSRSRAVLALQYPMSLGRYSTYEEAQKAVDYLSDHEFAVENVLIVGTDLKQLERVTGRLTTPRVIIAGAASGAWLGLLVGLLLGIFVQDAGGYGYSKEYEIERLYREAPMLLIGEGTAEIQKMIIGRRLLEEFRLKG